MTEHWNWWAASRCRTTDAEGLFVSGALQREAREFCRTCPVRTECLAHALDERIEFGVWGGMTERERRALLRSRADVRSWADLLSDARDAHYCGRASQGREPDVEDTGEYPAMSTELDAGMGVLHRSA